MQRPKQSTRTEQRRGMGFPIRLVLAGLLGVMLIPVALVAALYVPAVQDCLLRYAIQKLEADANLKIELASVRWSPARELRLFDLKVRAAGEDVLQCSEASFAYYLSWKWPHLYPTAIVLEKPSVHLERDAQGHWQLPFRKESSESTSGVGQPAKPFPWSRFPWPQVRIVSGNITASQNGQTILSISDANATVSVQEMTGSNGPWFKIDFGQWQGQMQVPAWGRWQFCGEAEIRDETLTLTGLDLNIPGAAQLAVQGQGKLAPPYDGTFELRAKELSGEALSTFTRDLSPLREVTGSLVLNHHSGKWFLDHDIKSNLGSLQGRLEVDPVVAGGPLLQFTGRFSDLTVPLSGQVSDSRLAGQVELTMSGTELKTAQASLHTLVEDSRWADQTIQRGELNASYEHGILILKPSRMQSSMGIFELSGRADLAGVWNVDHAGAVDAELRAEQASLDKLLGGSGQRVGGSMAYHGRYKAGGFQKWDQWDGEVTSNLVLPQFLTLKASGGQQNGLLNLDYELEVIDLQKLAALFPAFHGKGKVSSRGSIKGRYPDLLWDGAVSSPSLQLGPVAGEQISLKGKGRVMGKEGQRELTLKAQNLNVQGRRLGTLDLDLQQESDVCRFKLHSEAWGAQQGSARLSGRIEKLWGPTRTLLISPSTITWGKLNALLEGKVDAGKEGLRVPSLTLQRENEKVRLSGEVLFGGAADLKLSIDGINLGQWARMFEREIPVTGVVSGELLVKGPPDKPAATVNLQLVHGMIRIPSKTAAGAAASKKGEGTSPEQLIDRVQLQGSLAGDLLSIQGNLQSPAVRVPVPFTARVPMHLSLYPPQLALRTDEGVASSAKVSGLETERIMPYLDFLDRLGGRIDLDVQAGGTLHQPTVIGHGSWQDGSFRVTKWPHPIENIQLTFDADARHIIVQRSSMNLLGGDVQVTGRVAYPRFFEMDFEAEGTNLEVKDIYGTSGRASGHARLLQTPDLTRLTGVLHLSDGQMNLGGLETDVARTISVVDGSGKERTPTLPKETTRPNSFADRLEMDLTINLPPSGTWVHGKGLEVEITGDLKIEKRPFAGVKLHGGFQTLRGEYKFQDYKLKVVDGELIFPEGPQPEPQLKIVCQKELKDAIIQVHVTGPLKQPKLTMSSIPAMNQVDILSYLIFDRPAGDLSSNESFQLQDKAASWMGTQASILLKQVLGDTFFTPDTIEYRKSSSAYRVNSTAGTRSDATVVAIGKHVTPDLYINFEKGVTGKESDQVAVEYRFNRHFSVQTEFGGIQQSGIDVFWRYDFGK